MGKYSGLRSWNHKSQLCVCDYWKVFVNIWLVFPDLNKQRTFMRSLEKTAYLRQQERSSNGHKRLTRDFHVKVKNFTGEVSKHVYSLKQILVLACVGFHCIFVLLCI